MKFDFKNMFNKSKGFTLIELLVVISIIGVLSSVVLASLNGARLKAEDSSVKQQLISMRTAAQLFYETNNTYSGLCATNTAVGNMYVASWNQSSKGLNTGRCVSAGACVNDGGASGACSGALSTDKWAAVVFLRSASVYFCVDYSGIAREQAGRGIDTNPADADCN